MTIPKNLLWTLLALVVFQLSALAQSPGTRTIKVTLSGNGHVSYSSYLVSLPGPNGSFYQSGSVEVDDGFTFYMDLSPDSGYRVESLTDNGQVITSAGGLPYYNFPVNKDHQIVIRFSVAPPTGNFPLAFKDGTSATPIADVTGPYSGVLPAKKNPYTLDVAMDESGKVIGMGTLTGFTNSKGPNEGTNKVDVKGSLKTENGVPTVSGNASTTGELDGEDVGGSGKAKIPLALTPVSGGSEAQGVVASGSGKEGDFQTTQKPTIVSVPAQTNNLKKNWSLALSLEEKTDTKGKKYVVASSVLTLPDLTKTRFKEKKVPFSLIRGYSFLRGYSMTFTSGEKLDAGGQPILDTRGKPVIDRKSRIVISNMLLETNGGNSTPTAGLLKYGFLGQKGEGNLLDFL